MFSLNHMICDIFLLVYSLCKDTHIFTSGIHQYSQNTCPHMLIKIHKYISTSQPRTTSHTLSHTQNIRLFVYGLPSVYSKQGHMYSPEGLDLMSSCSLSSSAQLHKRLQFCSTHRNPCSSTTCLLL